MQWHRGEVTEFTAEEVAQHRHPLFGGYGLQLVELRESGLLSRFDIVHEIEKIGWLSLHYRPRQRTCNIGNIKIYDEFADQHRLRGVASAIYKLIPELPILLESNMEAIRSNLEPVTFVSSKVNSLSDGSRGVWNSLVRAGLAAGMPDGTYVFTGNIDNAHEAISA